RFAGYVTDNPIPSATNFLTLKTPKCNSPLNLEESETIEFKILPNPNSGKFQLQLPTNHSTVLKLFNTLGEIQTFAYEPNTTFDLDLLPGIYFLQLLGTDRIEKFIVQ
ncbi:MAG: T9SS type A sorting domain-containing protein, partial [Flavobacteriales bacterium]